VSGEETGEEAQGRVFSDCFSEDEGKVGGDECAVEGRMDEDEEEEKEEEEKEEEEKEEEEEVEVGVNAEDTESSGEIRVTELGNGLD